MKKHIQITILAALFLCTNVLFAQQVESTVTLNQPETSSRDVKATYSITLLPGFQTVSGQTFTAKIVDEYWYNEVVGTPYNLNENRNWVSSSSYDLSGKLTSSGVAYFNTLGKATQNQSLDIKTGKIWASEVRYDEFGKPVFSSLSAPVDSLNYGYDVSFLNKNNGSAFTQADLATINSNTSDVRMSTQKGKLGWYYSEANTSEKYQDVTNYPYSRTIYSTLNPGIALKTLGGNKVKKTASSSEEWLQSYSFNMPLTQELFYQFGINYFPVREKIVEVEKENNIYQPNYQYRYRYNIADVSISCTNNTLIRDIYIDRNLIVGKIYKISYQGEIKYYKIFNKYEEYINNGGGNGSDPIEAPSIQPIDENNDPIGGSDLEYLAYLVSTSSFHCPIGIPSYIKGTKTVVRDVHGIESVVFKDSDGNVLAAARSGNEDGAVKPKRKVISPINEQGYVDIHIPVGCGGNNNAILLGSTVGNYKIYDLITENIVHNNVSGTITLEPGIYRVVLLDKTYNPKTPYVKISGTTPSLLDTANTGGIEYSVNYYDYSLNYYDKAGRLTKSTQPLSKTLASTFTYNTLGQLLETTSPDEGKAEFKYRKDGQIRFSQNTKQKENGEFSYTNYDNLGRPIESGVATGNYENLNPNSDDFIGIRKEQHFTVYDEADEVGLAEALSRSNYGTNSINYKQRFVAGNVAKTYTENPKTTTTWYSYDVYGRVTWMFQDIDGLGVKSIDYEYDFATGQVTNVIYQKYHNQQSDSPRDYFEHKYTYNIAGELYKVETTSALGGAYTEQARYYYYETGALKRVQIAEDVQGIDYVYNLNGQLKAINHPSNSSSLDPGKDGTNGVAKDLFGFAIDYYNGDYTRANTPTPVVSAQGLHINNQYNGNIKATRWATNSIDNNAQASQVFSYNKNNWLKEASFGSANNSGTITSNSYGNYKVSGITYDANGNIQTLNRNKDGNGANALDRLTYSYNGHKKNQLERVEDAVTASTGADDIKNQTGTNYIYNNIGQLVVNKQDNTVYRYNASGLVTNIDKFATTPTANSTNYTIFQNSFEQYPVVKSGLLEVVDPKGPEPILDDGVFTGWRFTSSSAKGNGSLKVYKEPSTSTGCADVRNTQANMLEVFMKKPLDLGTENVTIAKKFTLVGGLTNTVSFNILKRKEVDTPLGSVQPITQYPLQVNVKDVNGVVLASIVVNPISTFSLCNNYEVQPVSFTLTPAVGEDKVSVEIIMLAGVNQETTFYIDDENVSLLTQPEIVFYYNDKGHRVRKVTGLSDAYQQNTYYVRDAAGSPMAIVTPAVGRTTDEPTTEHPIYGASRLGVYNRNSKTNVYQLTDHLGNVRAVTAKTPQGTVAINSATDYYPFGMPMPNRQIINGEPYRYTYQGQEKDPETGKEAFQLRLWDGRIGRWLSPDPASQFSSPYLGMGNNPITGIDPDGGKVIFPDKASAMRAMKNLNSLFKKKFGLTMDAISIKEYTYKYHKDRGNGGYELNFNKSKAFKKMIADLGLSSKQDFILNSFKDVLEADTEITGNLSPSTDKAARQRSLWDSFWGFQGLHEDRTTTLAQSDGGTYNRTFFKVNKELPDYMNSPTNFNIASTILHEVLWHISPMGQTWLKKIGLVGTMFNEISVQGPFSNQALHTNGHFQNTRISPRDFGHKGKK